MPYGKGRASARSPKPPTTASTNRYGFIGDYIGLAANREYAYAVWTDLRDLDLTDGVCAGHSCNGRRNQNVYFARIRK